MPKNTFFNLQEEKRKRILDSAIKVFTEKHYDKVTIDNIVNEAQIPKGSFYQYFENKDDLYMYMFSEYGGAKMNIFADLIEKIDDISFKDFLMQFIIGIKELRQSNEQLDCLGDEYLEQCPQSIKKKILKNELPKYYLTIEKAITLYIKKGEFRSDIDTKVASYCVFSCIGNLEYYNFDQNENPVNVLSGIIQLLDFMLKK